MDERKNVNNFHLKHFRKVTVRWIVSVTLSSHHHSDFRTTKSVKNRERYIKTEIGTVQNGKKKEKPVKEKYTRVLSPPLCASWDPGRVATTRPGQRSGVDNFETSRCLLVGVTAWDPTSPSVE